MSSVRVGSVSGARCFCDGRPLLRAGCNRDVLYLRGHGWAEGASRDFRRVSDTQRVE